MCDTKEFYDNGIRVYMLPAGKGDFIIVQFADRDGEHLILIDGGDKSAVILYKSILEKIKTTIGHIDAIIFTHIDDDHISGALCALMATDELPSIGKVYINLGVEIEKRFNIKGMAGYPEMEEREYLHIPSAQHSVRQALNLVKCLEEKGLQNRIEGCVCMGDCIRIGQARLKVISPGKRQLEEYLQKWKQEAKEETGPQHAAQVRKSKKSLADYAMEKTQSDNSVSNGSSIAFLFEYGKSRIAFLGDAFGDVCAEGTAVFYPHGAAVDLIKISHHGSARNYSEQLYQLLKSDYFLLSTKGTEKHPSPVLLGKIFQQNPKAKVICNSDWMKKFGFSDEDERSYLNQREPHIFQVRKPEKISDYVTVYSQFGET